MFGSVLIEPLGPSVTKEWFFVSKEWFILVSKMNEFQFGFSSGFSNCSLTYLIRKKSFCQYSVEFCGIPCYRNLHTLASSAVQSDFNIKDSLT